MGYYFLFPNLPCPDINPSNDARHARAQLFKTALKSVLLSTNLQLVCHKSPLLETHRFPTRPNQTRWTHRSTAILHSSSSSFLFHTLPSYEIHFPRFPVSCTIPSHNTPRSLARLHSSPVVRHNANSGPMGILYSHIVFQPPSPSTYDDDGGLMSFRRVRQEHSEDSSQQGEFGDEDSSFHTDRSRRGSAEEDTYIKHPIFYLTTSRGNTIPAAYFHQPDSYYTILFSHVSCACPAFLLQFLLHNCQ